MKQEKNRITAIIISLMTAAALLLTACNAGSPGTSVSSSSAGSAASTAASGEAASSQASSGELVGKPWTTTILQGNLPQTAPEIKDDVYTHYNYDALKEHQDKSITTLTSRAGELQSTVAGVIEDKSRTGHDLDQLRIFYEQAKDLDNLKKIGISEVQPYFDMIDAVTSIDKMNELLSSDKFPFTPFINAFLGIVDTRSNICVSIMPNYLLFDAVVGSSYYQDVDDPATQEQYDAVLLNYAAMAFADYQYLGLEKEQMTDVFQQVIAFEKAYGKHADSTQMYIKAEYGSFAEAAKNSSITLDKLCSLGPKLPIKGMLKKLKKDTAEEYSVSGREWITALNDLWTEENLETIKLVTKAKVLTETRPYRDPSGNLLFTSQNGTAESFAFDACKNLETFSHLVSKIYVDEAIGRDGIDRIKKLTADIIDAYKELTDKTVWLDDMSAALLKEKLDNITLNILEPVSGYRDFAGVDLKSTDKGGSLLSNYLLLKESRNEWESKKINKKASADTTWVSITPTMANAFYEATSNSINIYPGVVTSVLFDKERTDNDLLAGIGNVIGHEISHGFDYLGSQLDAYGAPKPIFSDKALKSFLDKCNKISEYFSTIEYLPGQNVNGQIIVAEATADLSGMQAILKCAEKAEGLDYDRFLKSLAAPWAQTFTQQELLANSTDTHPFNHLRVNVNLQMFDMIYDKMGVKEGDGMYLAPDKRIVLWNDK
ncbi:MAG: hypothetical protein IK152_05665 [Lachnospiraceae bacterium]|nr:hypothetical protein [Lachnospiraceae bacterium]